MADATFTKTSIGCAASKELSSFFGRFSLMDSSAASLLPRRRPRHVGMEGANSVHKNFNCMTSTIKESQKGVCVCVSTCYILLVTAVFCSYQVYFLVTAYWELMTFAFEIKSNFILKFQLI
jgi:hypothetical protein